MTCGLYLVAQTRRACVHSCSDLEKASKGGAIPPTNVIFDESGMFILYPTMLGIKGVCVFWSQSFILRS